MISSRTLLHWPCATLSLFMWGTAALGQTASAVTRGRETAERSCAGCHAMDGGRGGTIQGTPVPSFRAIAGRPNMTAERLQALVTTPRHPMPAIPLGLGEINDVVAYIRSLR